MRYFVHQSDAELQYRHNYRSPWSAPPRAFDPATSATDTPVVELTTLGLPRVDIAEEVELGGTSSEVQLTSERNEGCGGGANRSCLPTLPSSSVDW